MRRTGITLLTFVVLMAAAAPVIAPNAPDATYRDLAFAPPSRVYITDSSGSIAVPHIYPVRLVSRLERRYEEDRTRVVPLRWLGGGRLISVPPADGPLLLLGADSSGRDIFSRLLYGARTSIALALLSSFGAIVIGVLVGGVAGYAGGALDEALSRLSDFVLVLPAIYVVLALRAVLPLVLPDPAVFGLMAGIFALVGWPFVARGVRAIVASERASDYAQSARAVGAGHARMLLRHLVPATRGFVVTQATLLLPAFILAEATMSYVGLGFSDRTASWGTMLMDAANVAVLADVPWALTPAAAIFAVVLAVNLIVQAPLPADLRARSAAGARPRSRAPQF